MSLFHIHNDIFIVFNYIQWHHILVNSFVKELQDFSTLMKFEYGLFQLVVHMITLCVLLIVFTNYNWTMIFLSFYYNYHIQNKSIFLIVMTNHHELLSFILSYTQILYHSSFANPFILKFYFHLNIFKIYLMH